MFKVMLNSIIIGTGSYISTGIIPNKHFLNNVFYGPDRKIIEKPNEYIIKEFEEITCIKERRYVADNIVTSDISFQAAKNAFDSSGVDKESLDYIIVAHNFGDVRADRRIDFCPSIASRVKQKLEIENPKTIAYDVAFGCPGWLQGMIQADYCLKSGDAKRAMIIGAETLSKVSDPHDMDSMIYADGAGATIVESIESKGPVGILSHAARSDTLEHAYLLGMGKSYNPNYKGNDLFLKMQGHDVFKYALKTVPQVVKQSLDKAGLSIQNVQKVLLHQANEKMDKGILKNLYKLYGVKETPYDVLPMTISWLGNSSVATLPTLLDLLFKGDPDNLFNGKLDNHKLSKGDIVVFASVGAGMNINSMVYKMQ